KRRCMAGNILPKATRVSSSRARTKAGRTHRPRRCHVRRSRRKEARHRPANAGRELTIKRSALAKRAFGRSQLKLFRDWDDGQPETELNFKFYRQATNKVVGISAETASFLRAFF